MKKLFLWPSLLLLILVGLPACDDSERAYNPSTNPAVEARATALFEAMKAEDYGQVVAQYYEKFFAQRSKEEWVDAMKRLLAERGPLQRHILRRSQADTRFSGKFYILEYETVHDGDKRLHHVITVVLPVEGGEMQLVGHKMTPWEAVEAVTQK
ncbi:MAG: hypothetical protein RRB22_00755 [Gammaproteobacteria bacterium]|nr:hypothetical protein [Gammaproteobacteria bacterium]